MIGDPFSSLGILKILEVLAGSGVSLENTELGNSADQDENEADWASSTDALVHRLIVSADLVLVSSHAWGSLVTVLTIGSSVVLSMFTVLAMVSSLVVMLSLGFSRRHLSLGLFERKLVFSHFLKKLLLFFFLLFLDLVLKVVSKVLEELRQVELLFLEVSTTEVHRLMLELHSDVQVVSNSWIHILELSGLVEKETVEHDESKDAVEGSSEGNHRVLSSVEGSSNESPHGKHPHSCGKTQKDESFVDEDAINFFLIGCWLFVRHEPRISVYPWEVSSLSDVCSIVAGIAQGKHRVDEEKDT